MQESQIEKNFSDRLYEQCLLKNITEEQLISKFSKNFPQSYLEKCFSGKTMPSDVLLVGLSRFFNISVDAFFEKGERISDINILKLKSRHNKIEDLEKLLNKKISYSAENYNQVLKDNVQEALNKELMSNSYAAYILGTSVEEIKRTL